VHIEVERDWRPTMADRLFDYASAAVTATRQPVWSVLVLLRPGGHPPEGTGVYQVPGADGDAFVFRFQVVPLWQLDARQMQAQLGPAAAPFCAAMRGADEAFIRELAEGPNRPEAGTARPANHDPVAVHRFGRYPRK